MERTKNLKLIKPAAGEYYDVEQFNENSDIIDEAIQKANEDIKDVNDCLTTDDGLKFKFAKNEDGECGYLDANGEFVAFKKGGSSSVVLPPAPELTICSDDGKLTLSWEQPDATECEVDIASYNIYMSETAPFSLADMQLIATQEAGYKKMDYEHTLDVEDSNFTLKVRNNQVYVDGENYAEYYISPALQFEAGKTYRLSGADGTKCRMFIYGSDAINEGTIVTDAGRGCEFTASESAALPLALSIEPDHNTDSRFHIGIEEKVGDNSYTIEGLTNDKVYFVAVQAVTTDGIENASIYKIYRGVPTPTLFVFTTNGAKVYYSTDMVNWTQSTSFKGADSYSLLRIAYGGGRFVTVAYNGQSYASTDLQTWTSLTGISSRPTSYCDIVYGGDRFVMVCDTGYAYYLKDGATAWQQMTGFPEPYKTYEFRAVTYGLGMFVCVGNAGRAYYSIDGASWVAMGGLPTSLAFYHVAFGGGRFVCMSGTGDAYESRNGLTWTKIGSTGYKTTSNTKRLVYGMGRFVYSVASTLYLTDYASEWVVMDGVSNLAAITYDNNVFVGVNGSGEVYVCEDGATWNKTAKPVSVSVTAITNNKA